METMSFTAVRTAYERTREVERRKLSDFLVDYIGQNQLSLTVVQGGNAGKGRTEYTSHGQIVPFDLSNWKWVEVKGVDSDFNCIVSLNMPDVDPVSGNFHALFDRVGLLISHQKKQAIPIHTDIDLPFDEEKMGCIADLIAEQFDSYCRSKEN